ncbi:MAG: SH3 domain-containing protein [Kiritimatiellae bacterium]|nr:SH3 domain-containing protein [Kiritimatiellia bacterium]
MKQLRRAVAALSILVATGLVCGAETTPVKVVGERINLRARATLDAEVVGQVGDGEELAAKSLSAEWAEVVPPQTVDFWVHRDFISDGAVKTKRLNVRAGPGINYSVVGSLDRATPVAVRGEFGEWLKIAPPASCSLWVSREYVEPVRRLVPTMARRPPAPVAERRVPPSTPVAVAARERPQPVQVVVPPMPVEPTPAARWEIPADWELVPLQGQGNKVDREGYLRRVGFLLGRPSRFRLVQYVDSRAETLCYVEGDTVQLSNWLNERLLIRGREYWLQNVKYPVLVVDQITPRPFPGW